MRHALSRLAIVLGILLGNIVSCSEAFGADPLQKIWESTPFQEVAFGLAVSPAGHQFAVAGRPGNIVVFDTKSQKIIQEIEPTDQLILALRYSPDSSILAAVGPKRLMLYRTDNWKQLRNIPLPARCGYLCFHPTRPWIAVAGQGSSIDIYDIVTQKMVKRFDADMTQAQGVQFSANGRYLFAAVSNTKRPSVNHFIRRFDLQTEETRDLIYKVSKQAKRVIIAPNGNSLLVNVPEAGLSTIVKNIESIRVVVVNQWQADSETKMGAAFLPDATSILTAREGVFEVWSPGRNKPIASIPSGDAGTAYEIVQIPGTNEYLMCHERRFGQITRWRADSSIVSPTDSSP